MQFNEHQSPRRGAAHWRAKFGNAFRGVKLGVRGATSFAFHFYMTAAVGAAATVLNATLIDWCLLILCVTVVLSAEMFNSAIEHLARAITGEHHPWIGSSLDIGSAAVLLAALGAALVGTLVFAHRLGHLLGWWADAVSRGGG